MVMKLISMVKNGEELPEQAPFFSHHRDQIEDIDPGLENHLKEEKNKEQNTVDFWADEGDGEIHV